MESEIDSDVCFEFEIDKTLELSSQNKVPANDDNLDRRIVCKHWLRGLCKKGDKCNYLHKYDENKMPECFFFKEYGECNNMDCLYRHVVRTEATQECYWYKRGFCMDGPKCKNKHVKKEACEKFLNGICKKGWTCNKLHPCFELSEVQCKQSQFSTELQAAMDTFQWQHWAHKFVWWWGNQYGLPESRRQQREARRRAMENGKTDSNNEDPKNLDEEVPQTAGEGESGSEKMPLGDQISWQEMTKEQQESARWWWMWYYVTSSHCVLPISEQQRLAALQQQRTISRSNECADQRSQSGKENATCSANNSNSWSPYSTHRSRDTSFSSQKSIFSTPERRRSGHHRHRQKHSHSSRDLPHDQRSMSRKHSSYRRPHPRSRSRSRPRSLSSSKSRSRSGKGRSRRRRRRHRHSRKRRSGRRSKTKSYAYNSDSTSEDSEQETKPKSSSRKRKQKGTQKHKGSRRKFEGIWSDVSDSDRSDHSCSSGWNTPVSDHEEASTSPARLLPPDATASTLKESLRPGSEASSENAGEQPAQQPLNFSSTKPTPLPSQPGSSRAPEWTPENPIPISSQIPGALEGAKSSIPPQSQTSQHEEDDPSHGQEQRRTRVPDVEHEPTACSGLEEYDDLCSNLVSIKQGIKKTEKLLEGLVDKHDPSFLEAEKKKKKKDKKKPKKPKKVGKRKSQK